MRKSFDALSGLVSDKMEKSPINGDVYIFINKTRNRIKLLRWEVGGFVLFYKRLEKGTFELPEQKNGDISQSMGYTELAMLITGISMKYARKRQRFLQQNEVNK